jgi:hypothetical protein
VFQTFVILSAAKNPRICFCRCLFLNHPSHKHQGAPPFAVLPRRVGMYNLHQPSVARVATSSETKAGVFAPRQSSQNEQYKTAFLPWQRYARSSLKKLVVQTRIMPSTRRASFLLPVTALTAPTRYGQKIAVTEWRVCRHASPPAPKAHTLFVWS